jgi:hypothetical protein
MVHPQLRDAAKASMERAKAVNINVIKFNRISLSPVSALFCQIMILGVMF